MGDNHDKGGNRTQVRFYDRGTNMHRLWDSDMIEREGDGEDFWLADLAPLDTPENRVSLGSDRFRIFSTRNSKSV